LLLQQTVHPFKLLLLSQLNAIIGEFLPELAVISWGITPSFKGALLAVTPVSLEKQLQTLSPAQPAHGFSIPCQKSLPDR
jgi:hypothetical protein